MPGFPIGAGDATARARAKVKIATVSFKALAEYASMQGLRAMTTDCGVLACDGPYCVSHASEGCSQFDPTTPPIPCPHTCPSEIREAFPEYHRMPPTLDDPSLHPFGILVENDTKLVVTPGGANPWMSPAGALQKTGSGTGTCSTPIPPGGTGIACGWSREAPWEPPGCGRGAGGARGGATPGPGTALGRLPSRRPGRCVAAPSPPAARLDTPGESG